MLITMYSWIISLLAGIAGRELKQNIYFCITDFSFFESNFLSWVGNSSFEPPWQKLRPCGKPSLTLLHSEQPKLHRVLAVLSAVGLKKQFLWGVVIHIFMHDLKFTTKAQSYMAVRNSTKVMTTGIWASGTNL